MKLSIDYYTFAPRMSDAHSGSASGNASPRAPSALRDQLNASVIIGEVCEASDMILAAAKKLDRVCWRSEELNAALDKVPHVEWLHTIAADLARVAREAEE